MSKPSKPKRIQRKRTKGWRMPENAVYVGRPTKWGNPYSVEDCGSPERAVELFEDHIENEIAIAPENLDEIRSELAGRDLACWCGLDQPCHVDVLLRLANE